MYINQLMSDDSIQLLLSEKDILANELIINEMLKTIYYLPYKSAEQTALRLEKLAGNNSSTIENMRQYLEKRKLSGYWDKYLPIVIFLVTLLLCLLIYEVSNS